MRRVWPRTSTLTRSSPSRVPLRHRRGGAADDEADEIGALDDHPVEVGDRKDAVGRGGGRGER